MRLRHWVSTSIGIGLLLSASHFAVAENAPVAPPVAAEQFPAPCVKAGVTAKAACDALLAAQKAAAQKAADDKAAADKAAACVKAGVTAKAACDTLLAAQKAAAQKAADDKAAADKAAADKATADKAAAALAASQKAAADKAVSDRAVAAKSAADKAAAALAASQKAAADKAVSDQTAAAKAAADKAAADQAAAKAAAATGKQNQTSPGAQLPKECMDAGLKTLADCDALRAVAAQKAAAQKASDDKAAADKAAANKATADKAAAALAATHKAAADKAVSDQAATKAAAEKAAAALAATQKAAADKAVSDKAAAAKAAADKAAADQAAAKAAAATGKQNQTSPGAQLPKECMDAGLKTLADCDALRAVAAQKAANDKAAADKARGDKATADKAAAALAATQKAAADKAASDKAAAAKAAADKAAVAQAPAATGKQTQTSPGGQLPKDCMDAGLKTFADCDALHAIAAQKAKGKPASAISGTVPAAVTASPAVPAVSPAASPAPAAGLSAPAAPTGNLPAEVTPAKPAAAKPTQAPVVAAPALPDITAGLTAAAKSYNGGVEALTKAGANAAAAAKAKADIDAAQAQIDALCKSNRFDSPAQCLAQYAVRLSPLPALAGGQRVATPPVQPVEVIAALPKGVNQKDVAPLFDSAKDQKTGAVPAASASQALAHAAMVIAPPPNSDKAAQSGLKPVKVVPIDQQKGQQIAAAAVPQAQVPQNVTIVNQTIVNSTTNTTNTTNTTSTANVATSTPNDNASGVPQNAGQPPAESPTGLGLQVILQIGNQLIINSPGEDQRRISARERDPTSYEQLPHERYRETIERADGTRIVTVYNRNGDILRRSRFDRDGREYVLAYFDDQHEQDLLQWRDPGEDLPPLELNIPARDYVLDAGDADEVQVRRFFAEPPVERVQRLYSIDEVKRSARIRDMVRRIEIGDLHFDTGAATLSEDQVANLGKVAGAMLELLSRNPAETFLIEGHTDAVGSDVANLKLSDARATTVAQILTDFYHIPPENLATQGYGKRYLKVQTDLPEPLNRRVVIRRITSLVTLADTQR